MEVNGGPCFDVPRPRRRTVSPFCRITGKSHSMDEHHYIPCLENFPKLQMNPCCRVTEKNAYFKDYHHIYPVINQDGTTSLVTEHDFHCRVTSKYRAMAGHKYIYPLLGISNSKTLKDMESVVDNDTYGEVFIPVEVERLIRGGIQDVKKLFNNDYLFIYSKDGVLFPAALREVQPKRTKEYGKYSRRHTVPIDLEAQMALTLGGAAEPPKVRKIKELNRAPPEDLSVIKCHKPLRDVRKSRPRKPRRNKGRRLLDNKENEINNENEINVKNQKIDEETPMEIEANKYEILEEIIPQPTPLKSRMDKYKLHFQNFEVHESKTSKNVLFLIGAFDPNDVEELDFSENANEINEPLQNGEEIPPLISHTEILNNGYTIENIQEVIETVENIAESNEETSLEKLNSQSNFEDNEKDKQNNLNVADSNKFNKSERKSISLSIKCNLKILHEIINKNIQECYTPILDEYNDEEIVSSLDDGKDILNYVAVATNVKSDLHTIEKININLNKNVTNIPHMEASELDSTRNQNHMLLQNSSAEILNSQRNINFEKCLKSNNLVISQEKECNNNNKTENDITEEVNNDIDGKVIKVLHMKANLRNNEIYQNDTFQQSLSTQSENTQQDFNLKSELELNGNEISQNYKKHINEDDKIDINEKINDYTKKDIVNVLHIESNLINNAVNQDNIFLKDSDTDKETEAIQHLHRNTELKMDKEANFQQNGYTNTDIKTDKNEKMHAKINKKVVDDFDIKTTLANNAINEGKAILEGLNINEEVSNIQQKVNVETKLTNNKINEGKAILEGLNINEEVSNIQQKVNVEIKLTNNKINEGQAILEDLNTNDVGLNMQQKVNLKSQLKLNKELISHQKGHSSEGTKSDKTENVHNELNKKFDDTSYVETNLSNNSINESNAILNSSNVNEESVNTQQKIDLKSESKLNREKLSQQKERSDEDSNTNKSEKMHSKMDKKSVDISCVETNLLNNPISKNNEILRSSNVNEETVNRHQEVVKNELKSNDKIISQQKIHNNEDIKTDISGKITNKRNRKLADSSQIETNIMDNSINENDILLQTSNTRYENINNSQNFNSKTELQEEHKAVIVQRKSNNENIKSKLNNTNNRHETVEILASAKESYIHINKHHNNDIPSELCIKEPIFSSEISNELNKKTKDTLDNSKAKNLNGYLSNNNEKQEKISIIKEKIHEGNVNEEKLEIAEINNTKLLADEKRLQKCNPESIKDMNKQVMYEFQDNTNIPKNFAQILNIPENKEDIFMQDGDINKIDKFVKQVGNTTTGLEKGLNIASIENTNKISLQKECNGKINVNKTISENIEETENSILNACNKDTLISNLEQSNSLNVKAFGTETAHEQKVENLSGNQIIPSSISSLTEENELILTQNVLITKEDVLCNMNSRLPVTSSLMLKDSSLPVKVSTENRCQGLLDKSSGLYTKMPSTDDSPNKRAKWDNDFQPVDVYMAIMDFNPMETDEDSVPMKEGQQVEIIDATKPRRWLVRTRPLNANESSQEGWVPACYLEKSTAEETTSNFANVETIRDSKEMEAIENREAVVKELVETEEDFSKDMQFVVENYYKRLDDPQLPKELRDRKGSLFGNFKDISDFHNNVLMKGVYYHANEPTKLGKIFLRLERDFDMHASYCWNEARAQRILKDAKFKTAFENFSQSINDDKTISDHLKLPIQRLNDYQLLLKEIIKYSSRLNEDISDLQKALEFIHSINKRTKDLQCIQSIQGCQGDLLKLGRIIKHETFDHFEDVSTTSCECHVFLFKGRMILTQKVISEADEIFQAINAFKLQDVEVIENLAEDPLKILFRHKQKHRHGFPFYLRGKSSEQKDAWTKEMHSNLQVSEDLGEDEPVVIQDVSPIRKETNVAETAAVNTEIKHKIENSEIHDTNEPEKKKSKTDTTEVKEDVLKSKERKTSLKRQASLKKSEDNKDTAEEKPLQRRQSIKRQDSQGKKKKSVSDIEADVAKVESELPPKVPSVKRQESLDKTSTTKEEKKGEKVKNQKETPEKSKEPSSTISVASKKEVESKKQVKDITMPEKPSFVKALRGVTCGLGEKAIMECETAGNPVPSVTWLKDNQRLNKGKKIETSSKGQKHSLIIKETTPEDGGLYTVVANNAQGSASSSALLNLKLALLGLPKEDSRPSTPGGTILPHAPIFKVKLNKETQLLDGTCVRFELVVRGNPEPTVKFFKNGKELKQDERVRVAYENKEIFELVLDRVNAKDAGTYSCEATNSLGSDTTTGNLCVVKTKDVFKGLEEFVEEERSPTPRPRTPKFKWFKDGQDFEASERFQVIFNEEEDSLALMFQHVTPEDAGLYTCVANTSTGSKIACSAELTVQGVVREVEAPAIKAELSDTEATEGGSAMLELKITGYPKPKVTWFHKKKAVESGGRYRFLFADEETFTLVIKNVKKDDSGQYSVKAVNEIGEAHSSCQVTVKSAPSFTKGLKDMSVMADEILAFDIEVDANPVPDVKWYKDGQQLKPDDRIKIQDLGKGKYSLKISKAKQTDSGSYSCVVNNALGSQAEFSNVVVKASPTFIRGMKDVEGVEKDSLQFTVEVNGNPKPSLKWTKDGKELKIDGKHVKVIEEGINTYTLVVENATPADVGVYTCELRNDHGMKASSGNLALKTKPEFVKKLTDMEVNESDTGVLLSVSVKGHPTATVKWLLEGSELAEDKNYAITSDLTSLGANLAGYTLKLKKVSREMAGKYTCEASNEMGLATSSGVLSVKVLNRKPEFEESLKPTQLVEGKPGKLVANVSGAPRPKIQWLKDGRPITIDGHFKVQEEPDGTIYLLIDEVGSSDAGTYSVVAISAEGEAKCSAAVTTIPPGRKPEFLKELDETTVMESKPLCLTAKVTGHPTSIKWQKDGKDIIPSDQIIINEEPDGTVSLKIKNATISDAGKYAIVASNAEGKARSVALVQVKACTKPNIDLSLKPLTLVDGETGKLKLKISGEPKPTLEWLKDGKPLKMSNRVDVSDEPDGTTVLTINNARVEDAGKYTVIAKNDMGQIECAAPVEVQQSPAFQKPLESVNVVEGYPAKLEAKLSGSPPPEIKWMKDGKELTPDGTHIKELRSPDGTVALLIDDCKPEDAAKYSLIAKNNLGEKESNGSLSVSGKTAEGEPESVPSFIGPLSNVSVKEGEPIRFEAQISGNPLPEIKWSLNGENIKPSDNKLITFDGKKAILDIKNCSPEDAGTYQCIVSNPLGKASSEGTATVQNKTAPRFIQHLTDYTGFVGNPLILSCRVKAYPEADIDWFFNGNRITPGAKYSITKAGDLLCLSVNNCQPEDSGLYECKAENSIGEDRTRSAVNISDKMEKGEPPSFLKKIGDCEVMEGMTAKFTACVTGTPTPDVKWAKDGQPLELSPRHKSELDSTGILRLIIRDIDSSDYGEYSAAISNLLGSATSSAHIRPDSLDQKYISPMGDQFVGFNKFKETGAPVPLPDKPRIIRMSDDALTLGWKPSVPNAPRTPVTYQIEMSKHPGGEYELYKMGLKDTLCDVRGLIPGQDYKFRIRVENKHGISEPSPYTTAHRSKLHEPYKPADFVPSDFDIEHPPLEKYAAPPRFLRKEEDQMYGVRGQPVTIEFWLYGHPEPEVTWFKDDVKIGKDKFAFMQDRNGKLALMIDTMTDDFVGTYLCHAVNSEGEARMKIKLLIAERPVFTQKLDETTSMSRRSARMQCKVSGIPYPKIKWHRDWHPLYESDRVKLLWEEPDTCTLFLTNLIGRDAGLFSCSASNIAGTATTSATLNVEDSEDMFDQKNYSRPLTVKPRSKKFEDFYDIGDELGRGTQGIVSHVVKRSTGDSHAAKMMIGSGKFRNFMKSELDVMNQLGHPKLIRLYDAFETPSSLTLVTDVCGGGELLNNILQRGTLTEREVAYYIKQLLEGLEHMHGRYIGHLGLTIGDLLVSRVNSYDIKVGDFGLAAHLIPGKDYILEYGHPEFVAPEIANKLSATLLSDMWSVGVITYLLLSGLSPFLGHHDRETLTQVKEGKINFSENAFSGVSDDAKDFMSKLLVFDPSGRINVKTALQHKWIKYYADLPSSFDKPLDNIDRLRDYYKKWKEWYANASCKHHYRRRTLESCFHDASKMIYPPGECYTPEASPDREFKRPPVKPCQFDDITFRQKMNREDVDFRSESHYQNGPDTYLLQLRDPDFPTRLREYLRVGARTSPSLAANLRDSHWGDSTLVIRERRKFVDIMDEEIGDEKRGLGTRTIPMRLHHEIGTLGYAHEQMELLKKEVWKDKGSREIEIGMAAFFREKIRDVVMKEDEEVVFRCYAVGTPKPKCIWFRNDGVLLESSRIVVTDLKDGRSEIRIKPSRAYDVGIYKCVARNDHGFSVCRARLKLGSKPGRPEPPVIKDSSDTEVYLTWTTPKDDGRSDILCYSLEYKQSVCSDWTTVASNITHEYFVIRNLLPALDYQFRIKAMNRFGWGEPGFPTASVETKGEGAEKVKVSPRRKFQQELTEQSSEYEPEDIELLDYDYNIESNPIPIVEGDVSELYRIVSEMDRGRFSVVLNVWVKESGSSSVAKVIQSKPGAQSDGRQEYEILKSLCHERIVSLLSASFKGDKTVLVMEKLSGVDVLTYLSSKQDYNEEMVVYIIRQVLDAIEYLHFRGICYLELQPDNVVMIDQRRPDIKLLDFGASRFVPKSGGKALVEGVLEYLAPEVIKNENVMTGTDVWCVGVLTYILLSGVSPFRGKNDQETTDNVLFVRYQFDHLPKDVTMEATKFLLQVFKACPIKRPTVSECLENKWLAPSEYMIMKRESARFLPDKLSAFSKNFHKTKFEAMNPEMLTSLGISSTRTNVKDDDF